IRVTSSALSASNVPPLKMLKLCVEHRRTDLGEMRVDSVRKDTLPALETIICDASCALRCLRIGECHEPSIRPPAKVLTRIETEGGGVAETTDYCPLAARSMGLTSVLNHPYVPRPYGLPDVGKRRWIPIQMNGDDRAHLWSHHGQDRLRR